MPLREEFNNALMRVQKASSLDATAQLHQLVLGPPQSGRTTEAMEYAATLVTQRHASHTQTLDLATAPDDTAFKKALADSRGGSLVIDNAHLLARNFNGYDPIILLKNAYDERRTVFILVGEQHAMETALKEEAGLKRRFSGAVYTERTFKQHEMDAYNAARAEEARRAGLSAEERDAEDRKAASVEEWRQRKDVDVAVNSNVKPLKTLRFGPKAGQ